MALFTSLSSLELRRILESAFLPDRCVCTIPDGRHMTVVISDPETRAVKLTVLGISADRLANSRSISELVAQLRYELKVANEAAGKSTAIS